MTPQPLHTFDPYARVVYRHIGLPTPRESADDVVVFVPPTDRPPVPPRR